jgi:hypothetical protein
LAGLGRVAREQDRRALPLRRSDRGYGTAEMQRDRVILCTVERVVVELVARRDLDDPPEVHDRDPVRDVPDDREVVRDEEVRELELAPGAPPAG